MRARTQWETAKRKPVGPKLHEVAIAAQHYLIQGYEVRGVGGSGIAGRWLIDLNGKRQAQVNRLQDARELIPRLIERGMKAMEREGDYCVQVLSPDAEIVVDASCCIVIRTPERRITVGDVEGWRDGLLLARTYQGERIEQAEEERQERERERIHAEHMRRREERRSGLPAR